MCLLIYGVHAWGRIKKNEEKGLEKIKSDLLKRLLNLLLSTPYTGILMKTGIWPVLARINYLTRIRIRAVLYFAHPLGVKLKIRTERIFIRTSYKSELIVRIQFRTCAERQKY